MVENKFNIELIKEKAKNLVKHDFIRIHPNIFIQKNDEDNYSLFQVVHETGRCNVIFSGVFIEQICEALDKD
jgi:hypothetical protein